MPNEVVDKEVDEKMDQETDTRSTNVHTAK
jgi:hypothetical protein